MFSIFGTFSRVGIVVLLLAFAAGGYAFTAQNTVSPSQAGDGNNAVSGYTISGIHYALDSGNPSNVDEVQFDLDPAAPSTATVAIKIGGNKYGCLPLTSPQWFCITSSPQQLTVSGATNLEVVAAQ